MTRDRRGYFPAERPFTALLSGGSGLNQAISAWIKELKGDGLRVKRQDALRPAKADVVFLDPATRALPVSLSHGAMAQALIGFAAANDCAVVAVSAARRAIPMARSRTIRRRTLCYDGGTRRSCPVTRRADGAESQ